jgi:hypothetical protein
MVKPPNDTVVEMGPPAAGTTAGKPYHTVKPRPEIPDDCPLAVGFASYGAGIDLQTYRSIVDLLESDAAVLAGDPYRWGREGEVVLCVTPRSTADAERLFHLIKAAFPAEPHGPLGVRTKSGLSHQVSG